MYIMEAVVAAITVSRLLGNSVSAVILILAGYSTRICETVARFCVGVVSRISGAVVEADLVHFHEQREHGTPSYATSDPAVIDEKTSLSNSGFPFTADQLIEKTKELLSSEAELGTKRPELLSGDFQFVFPIVGPLGKDQFCGIYGGTNLREAFPKMVGNFFGFTVDPLEPNRVWFFSRAEMKHEGVFKFGSQSIRPTGKKVVITPQVLSMSFDREGRCYRFTGGYAVDKTVGNCGGLGGIFGILYSLGSPLPFPECRPWTPSLEWEGFAKRVHQIGLDWRSLRKVPEYQPGDWHANEAKQR